MTTATEMGRSLKAIRDERLWDDQPEEYQSFEDYCLRRFGMPRSIALQLISAVDDAERSNGN